MDAHLLMARLESEEIECWLKDENTVTIDPLLTNAVGGIKLMVKKEDFPRAYEIFRETEANRKNSTECPNCRGHNVEYVSSPRKPANLFTAIFTYLIGGYALSVDNVYHCFDCGNEFKQTAETSAES